MSVDHPDYLELSQDDLRARIDCGDVDAAELARRYGQDGAPPADALDASVIERRLEALVDQVLSVRRAVAPAARALAWFPRARVESLLGQIARACRTSLDLGYHLCTFAPEVLRHLEDDAIPAWMATLLDTYDRQGSQGGIRLMRQLPEYGERVRGERAAAYLARHAAVLEAFVTGLAGRPLKLHAAEVEVGYTDTETLYLPERLTRFDQPRTNYLLYKATVAHLWAQTWFGTWRGAVQSGDWLAARGDDRLQALFGAVEAIRLDACLARALPGLWREMRALAPLEQDSDRPAPWREAAAGLERPGAPVALSWSIARRFAARGIAPPPPRCYHGSLHPEAVAAVMAARVARERAALQRELAVLAGQGTAPMVETRAEFWVRPVAADDWPDGFRPQPMLGDQPVQLSFEARQLLQSIAQDFGRLPEEYLHAAGHGVYRRHGGAARDAGDVDAAPVAGHVVYDEWDYTRSAYRKGWCQVRERELPATPGDFVERTRTKYRGLIKQLVRTFEALRGADALLRREPHGEDPDIDAIVAALADQVHGLPMDERLFLHRRRVARDVAVLFMVDMSGSTKGWINAVQREALVLLCEALERLDDRYALYGFSGFTHTRCDIYRIKDFSDPYDDEARRRIASIEPRDYTRMGVAIRHLTRKLTAVAARTRVLMVLSDGRPDDEDGYRGDYGIEDTRRAVLEACNQGVHPFCVTIDDQAQDYLPRLFGPSRYALVENLTKLPYRVADIYRRITAG